MIKALIKIFFREYKNVATDIPDWTFRPEPNTEAQAYWQFLFAKHHEEIANIRELQPADIPPGWKNVTPENALENLKKMFFKS